MSANISTASALREHFDKIPLESLVTATRTFPTTSRVDLQLALNRVFGEHYEQARLVGVHTQYSHETLTFGHLTRDGDHPVHIAPLQQDEVDVGDKQPIRCLKQGLWLTTADFPFAVLLTPAERFGRSEGMHLEIAVPPGEAGFELSRAFFETVTRLLNESASYRGKVISLETSDKYSGKSGGVTVHKLRQVKREDVILPELTLRLLEQNVNGFIAQRAKLRAWGMPVKKGLLFYGPPGTGKTHTIHYLASQLPGHTTLLITADQVGLLDTYVQLARFLQPAMVVIEDVDLIARARENMRSGCEESLLNRLLNEMDGLREDAEILFVLTTNRPEQLEAALASRPGRVDQAIEFPLPDDIGRRKLVKLYARGMTVTDEVVDAIVRKTVRASGAFIKELMRRCAQHLLQAGGEGPLALAQIEGALDEMLFSGGSLNVKLLGGDLASVLKSEVP